LFFEDCGAEMVQSEHYHVGIVVPDLVVGRAHFEDLLGVVWGPIMEYDAEFRNESDDAEMFHLKLCYSTVAPYLELIEELPGTVWECNEYSNLHHIGFWSDAVQTDADRWTETGCPFMLGPWEDGEIRATYHQDRLGVRLELVSTTRRELIEQTMCVAPTGT
jgi:hypothetical protein